MVKKLFLLVFLLAFSFFAHAKEVYDLPECNIGRLFKSEKTKYIIRYRHVFNDTLYVPYQSVLVFEDGSLTGPIVFSDTKLEGKVNLKGSSIFGSVRNNRFDASWLCVMDGVTDDASIIRDILGVCNSIYFPRGIYRLCSECKVCEMLSKEHASSIKAHIGIDKSDVKLIGADGAELVTDMPLGVICIYSRSHQIENSVRNIKIEGLTFTVNNNGDDFHEFIHTIKVIGVNGIEIQKCKFRDFWGDAICLSHYGDDQRTGERTRNQNVRILNNTIIGANHHNNRNGISVINGENVLIKNNIIKNTSRKNMPGGIDIEPNNVAYTIKNINIEDNIIEGVRGTMGAIGIVLPREGASAYDVSIVNNIIRDCSWGISVCVTTDMTSSNILIAGNHTDYKTNPYNFGGGGSSKDWIIKNNVWDKPRSQVIPGTIKVKNLVIKNNKKKV